MLKLLLITILMPLKFLHASEGCEEFEPQFQVRFNGSNETLYQCPVESEEDIEKFEKFSESEYELGYCLFKKTFADGEPKVCKSKVKPIFGKMYDEDGKVVRCGNGRNQFLHHFSHNYCGNESVLQYMRKIKTPRDLNKYLSGPDFAYSFIYEYKVCYDTSQNRTIWTNHEIHEYTLPLDDLSFIYDPECLKDISTDTFNLKTFRFDKLKQLYEEEEKKDSNSNFIMKPQPLVPPQHFSNWASRRSTNHYINMAPLSSKLVPLMVAIDRSIRKAAQKIFKTIGTRLEIYTAVEDLSQPQFFTRMKSMLFHTNESLNQNVWYKFVYNKLTAQSMMIFIHNTLETKVEKKCNNKFERVCDFLGWAGDKSLSQSVSSEDLKYVYCCQVTSEMVRKIFSKDLNMRHYLDLGYYFNLD